MRQSASLLWMVAIAAAAAGCVEQRVVKPSFASLRAYADQPSDRSTDADAWAPGGGGAGGIGGWSILLAELDGQDRYVRANRLFAQLHEQELPQVWYEDSGEQVRLYCGRFADPAASDAQMVLKAVTAMELAGDRPFRRAAMTPLDGGGRAAPLDPLDLRQYTGFYTLEIAVFTPDYTGDRRAAAEQLARDLRHADQEAYFYHGPRSSSVCLGLFDDSDFVLVGQIHQPGPRMKQMQEQHPGYAIDGRAPESPQASPSPDDQTPLPPPSRSHFVEVL